MNCELLNMTYFIENYGCEMNIAESAAVEQILIKRGWTKAEDVQLADFVVINTCSVRGSAEERIFGRLGFFTGLKKVRVLAKDAKRRNMEVAADYVAKNGPKPLTVVVMGCMAERLLHDLKKQWPVVDYVVGTFGKEKFHEIIPAVERNQKYEMGYVEPVYKFAESYYEENAFSTFVPIMHGCNNFCTYCIVPYTRGKQRSRKSEDILKEVKELKQQGYKEITLLGQNVNAYGKDLDNEIEFSKLLEQVSDIGIERIRFVTSHPWDFTDSMIDVIAARDNIMPYIHLPLQSGSDRILKLMGRRYTKEEYLTLFNKIRTKVKNASITTDIIVGFPGETEEDFKETLDVVDKCHYDGAFTFIFSPREGTPASKMTDETPLSEKEERLQRLNEKINAYSKESNERMLNTIQKVLITGVSEKDPNKVCGYTENMKLVNVEADKNTIGQIIDVKITEAKSFSLDGIISK